MTIDSEREGSDGQNVEPEVAGAAAPEVEETVEETRPPIPDSVDLNEFQRESVAFLHELGVSHGLRVGGLRSKHEIVYEILSYYGRRGCRIEAEGCLEVTKEGNGFLRWPAYSFAPNPDDVYVASALVRKSSIRPGSSVRAVVRAPREKEKYLSVEEFISVEGRPYGEWENPTPFDKLTALFPSDRIILENAETESVAPRVVDLIAPLGKGQRGLIVAPPRAGKTILLKDIASAITKNHKEIELIILLLDERPEEVTDFIETVDAPVYSSTFDESPQRHVQVADLVSERARRLVELGKDVVILLDSITRLARGHNAMQSGKGRTMSGGVDSKALTKPKKFFSAARNVEGGGSLTILATALIETESRMDEVIFEEFKGTGNMEIYLDHELSEKRIFPAIHTMKSGTRKDELLYHPDEHKRVNQIRKQLAQLPAVEAMEVLVRYIRNTSSNAELLLRGINT
ncbi:MAG: transcription termination factor Rho [Verrucomicrobiota bacterium]